MHGRQQNVEEEGIVVKKEVVLGLLVEIRQVQISRNRVQVLETCQNDQKPSET